MSNILLLRIIFLSNQAKINLSLWMKTYIVWPLKYELFFSFSVTLLLRFHVIYYWKTGKRWLFLKERSITLYTDYYNNLIYSVILKQILCIERHWQTSFSGMIKDGGTNPSTTCKIAAQQLAADSDIVGVVGAMRSSCSKASHQYFRDNGKKIMDTNVCSSNRARFVVRISLL